MRNNTIEHYKEDFEHACDELKKKDKDISLLRKRINHLRKIVGEKNLEIAKLNKKVKQEQGR
jgi:peptidoglycan hydrolase CwlO-like protein